MTVIISGMAWLPSGDLNDAQKRALRHDLTVQPRLTTNIAGKAAPEPILMWEEDEERGLFGIPRSYYEDHKSGVHEEIVQVSRGGEMNPDLVSLWTAEGPYEEQGEALEKLLKWATAKEWCGGILQAGCGFGKSNLAIEFAFRLKRRTIILVHKDFLMRQWAEYIRTQIPLARIGFVQQSQCDFEGCDYVIGMMQSLAKNRYPKELYRAFGVVIPDEVHRCPASTWAPIPPRFEAAIRLGLSATPRRKDGAEAVFHNHIGRVVYKAYTKTLVPRIRVISTTTRLAAIKRGDSSVPVENLNTSQVASQLVLDRWRTDAISEDVVQAVKNSRKIIVVSERLEHLRELAERFKELCKVALGYVATTDYYTGDWFTGEVWEEATKAHKKGEMKAKKRTELELKIAESAQVLFATRQMVAEAFNVPSLDVLVIATPTSDPEQEVGRIQRWCLPKKEKCERLCPWRAGTCTGKPPPIVVDVVDDDEGLQKKFRRRLAFYKSIGADC